MILAFFKPCFVLFNHVIFFYHAFSPFKLKKKKEKKVKVKVGCLLSVAFDLLLKVHVIREQ